VDDKGNVAEEREGDGLFQEAAAIAAAAAAAEALPPRAVTSSEIEPERGDISSRKTK
jgi:hypothetical protein